MQPDPFGTTRTPPREPDRAAVREQLERMLLDPLFKHSKRYPNLLRYVVERTLEGAAADLKERTLGIAVFGREPSYDTSTDPVVRATAGEIRKRIAQYYQEPGREHEIRISLSPGSYVPEFSWSPADTASSEASPGIRARRRPKYTVVAGALAVALLIGTFLVRPWAPRTALADFWRPVLDSSNTVLICIGQRRFLGTSPESPNDATGDIDQVRKGLGDPGAHFALPALLQG